MEIALSIREKKRRRRHRRAGRPDVVNYKPAGAVLVPLKDRVIIKKWCEIAADLMSPWKRGEYTKFKYHAELAAVWKQDWYDAYQAYREKRRHTKADLAQLWADIRRDGDLLGALGLDPRGDVHVTQTWVWSRWERRRMFIVKMDEALLTDEQIDGVGNYSEDGPDNPLLPPHLRRAQRQPRINPAWEERGVQVQGPRHRIDWETDLPALSQPTIDQIKDPTFVFHPRLNHPVPFGKIKLTSAVAGSLPSLEGDSG